MLAGGTSFFKDLVCSLQECSISITLLVVHFHVFNTLYDKVLLPLALVQRAAIMSLTLANYIPFKFQKHFFFKIRLTSRLKSTEFYKNCIKQQKL